MKSARQLPESKVVCPLASLFASFPPLPLPGSQGLFVCSTTCCGLSLSQEVGSMPQERLYLVSVTPSLHSHSLQWQVRVNRNKTSQSAGTYAVNDPPGEPLLL